MITSDKMKVLVRVLENGKVMVRDFDELDFKMFPSFDKAMDFIKELYIKKEVL